MDIKTFIALNIERCFSVEATTKWGDTSGRDLTDWAVCVGGEAGEVLNATKKLMMHTPTSQLDSDHKRQEVAKELADVITYAFIMLHQITGSPVYAENVLLAKFYEVSQRINWSPSQ